MVGVSSCSLIQAVSQSVNTGNSNVKTPWAMGSRGEKFFRDLMGAKQEEGGFADDVGGGDVMRVDEGVAG
ncbi:hypothetical protein VNO78_18205 [Psophocarpus tetragonolobus]|uniref:Uncharacterized protein n=1 Tax=Psophocarpus tetragonolobus TaxID=3891 RepID=A0AAN9SK59_PSOTE